MDILGKILLFACGAGLIYGGIRLASAAFRFWRFGLAARGMLAALIGAVYTVSPIDGIPDVIVGIGWLDDLIVLGMVGLYIWRLLNGRRPATRRATPRPVVIPQLPPR